MTPDDRKVHVRATWKGQSYDLGRWFSARPWPDPNPFPRFRLFRWLP